MREDDRRTQYLKRAADFRRKASIASSYIQMDAYLDIAKEWLLLAEEAEKNRARMTEVLIGSFGMSLQPKSAPPRVRLTLSGSDRGRDLPLAPVDQRQFGTPRASRLTAR